MAPVLLEYVAAVVPWVWDVWDQDTGEVPTGSTGVRGTGRPQEGPWLPTGCYNLVLVLFHMNI